MHSWYCFGVALFGVDFDDQFTNVLISGDTHHDAHNLPNQKPQTHHLQNPLSIDP